MHGVDVGSSSGHTDGPSAGRAAGPAGTDLIEGAYAPRHDHGLSAPSSGRDDGSSALDAWAPRPDQVPPPDEDEPRRAAPEERVQTLTVLARLREGRLDPGRRAVAGLAVVGLLAALVTGLLLLRSRPREVVLPEVERAGRAIADATLPSSSAAPATGEQVVVAVAGEVRRPGLVRLPAGSRVDDALRAAGGVRPGASPGLLNLARRLVDGEQVLVGVEAPAGAGAPGPGGTSPGGSALLDLNAATASDLDQLPGIGPVLAERIVDYRTANGPFRSVDQLREVSGIGEAKYASLKDAVTV